MQWLYTDPAGLLKDRLITEMVLCRYPACWSFGQPKMGVIFMDQIYILRKRII
jgi:hypothetical protein